MSEVAFGLLFAVYADEINNKTTTSKFPLIIVLAYKDPAVFRINDTHKRSLMINQTKCNSKLNIKYGFFGNVE